MSDDCMFLVSGRWDDTIVIVSLACALDPANDGTDMAIVNTVRVTPDLTGPAGPIRASGQPVGIVALPARDRLFVVNHSGSASPEATSRFQHGHPGTIAVLGLEAALDPALKDPSGAILSIVPTGTCGPVGAALTPNGRHIVLTAAEGDGTEDGGRELTVFEVATERIVHRCRFRSPGTPPSRSPGPHPSFGAYPNPNGVAISARAGGLVFTGNGGTDDLSVLALPAVLDGRADGEIARIAVEAGPFGIAVSSDGRLVAAASRESAQTGIEGSTVAVLEAEAAARGDPGALLAEVPVGVADGGPSRPFSVAFTPDGEMLCVTCFRTDTLAIVDPRLQRQVAQVLLARPDRHPARPRGLALSPDGRYAAVAAGPRGDARSGCLHIVDLARSEQVATVIGVGNEPYTLTAISRS